jgi:D-alanyl-D-alanine carboxypeptidase (penicillin-binding protein 5/6)
MPGSLLTDIAIIQPQPSDKAFAMNDKWTLNTLRLKAVALVTLLVLSIGAANAAGIDTAAREAYLIDANTGAVLLDKNGHEKMPPASMSKLMTAYLLFDSLKNGSVSLDDTFQVSENAWRKGGAASGSSTMFLPPNSSVRVEDLIRGIIVQSGNDACIVVAENLAGSEEQFARRMTAKARELGMNDSTFANSTGWPDPMQRMSAHDLAILAQRIVQDFPEFYHYYSEREFTFNDIRQSNRNPLLYGFDGADGLKTGHTREAGYGLTASAMRDDRRLVLVVNGLESRRARAEEAQRLLGWGFREFGNYKLFSEGDTVEVAPVWLGNSPTIEMKITSDVDLTMKRSARRDMKVSVRYASPVPAPITAGQAVGTLVIEAPDFETIEVPLVASEDVTQLGMFGRLGAALEYILWGESG